jgi:hypothetical protein
MKKIVLGTLLVGLIGILVVGAAIRTMDKTGNVAEARGAEGAEGAGWRGGQGSSGETVAAAGRNQGAGALSAGTLAGEGATAAEDWMTYAGTVVQAPAAGTDMIVATDEGEEIVVGTGPGYLDEMGLSLAAGEQVQVQGYWEDDEFKAGQVTRLSDGATVALRDAYGRPAWSGAGQRQNAAVATTGEAVGQGAGQQAVGGRGAGGQGAGGQGAGGQGAAGQGVAGQASAGVDGSAQAYGGEGNLDAPGDGLGTGQAQVDEWLTLAGTVTVANDDELIVQIDDGGGEVLLEGRALRFLQDEGFQVQVNQRLSLTGFYEDGDFEVGAVKNLTTLQSMMVRDENGRPLWAGRGRRSG